MKVSLSTIIHSNLQIALVYTQNQNLFRTNRLIAYTHWLLTKYNDKLVDWGLSYCVDSDAEELEFNAQYKVPTQVWRFTSP